MDHLPTKPCEVCGKLTEMRIRRARRWWPRRWHWVCPGCSPAILDLL